MSKRFIDTAIFRKDFIRGLEAPYKLLWIYIINECDHAGIWDVELDVAETRLGVKFKSDPRKIFGEKIIQSENGKKWFIPSFIEFQYGVLNPDNRAHQSAIALLRKQNFIDDNMDLIKPLTSPLQGAMDMDKEPYMDMVKEKRSPISEIEIPDAWPRMQFDSLWVEYVAMRKAKKKPLAGNAVSRRLAQLVTASNGSWTNAEKIMLRSIDKAWDEFYPLDQAQKQTATNHTGFGSDYGKDMPRDKA